MWSDVDGAGDTRSAGEGGLDHQVRLVMLKLKVCLVGEGAHGVEVDCSPEILTGSGTLC